MTKCMTLKDHKENLITNNKDSRTTKEEHKKKTLFYSNHTKSMKT